LILTAGKNLRFLAGGFLLKLSCMQPVYILIPAMLVSLLLVKLYQHFSHPWLAILNRWLRWPVMAGSLAILCQHFGWDGDRPFWVLCTVFLIVWLLLDGVYRWLAINAMSVSLLPLFPRFMENKAGDEWPVQRRFLTLRDELRAAGFKQIQSLRSEVAQGVYVRVSIYQDTAHSTRLQVSFLPQTGTGVLSCLQFSSITTSGTRLVTDNHHLAFAGFYPETWRLERLPRMRSFKKLWSKHQQRLATVKEGRIPWSTHPLDDLNNQQSELERLNTELGFLLPSPLHEEHGRISHEGRFRVWKEMLTLDYFGKSAHYE
jgi:hypothetical protein